MSNEIESIKLAIEFLIDEIAESSDKNRINQCLDAIYDLRSIMKRCMPVINFEPSKKSSPWVVEKYTQVVGDPLEWTKPFIYPDTLEHHLGSKPGSA